MWELHDLSLSDERELDFSSSGQGRHATRRLIADGHDLVNAVDLVSCEGDSVQLFVCEQCGIRGCAAGGWAVVRRAGRYALLMPDFACLVDEPEMSDYWAPPKVLLEFGAPAMTPDVYGELRRHVRGLPRFDELSPLLMSEALRLLQFEAPYRLLGRVTEPIRLRVDLVIAGSTGDADTMVEHVRKLVDEYGTSTREAWLRREGADDRPLDVFLEVGGFDTWTGLAETDNQLALRFAPGFVIVPRLISSEVGID